MKYVKVIVVKIINYGLQIIIVLKNLKNYIQNIFMKEVNLNLLHSNRMFLLK